RRDGVSDLRDADRVLAPHPGRLESATPVRPGGPYLERRQPRPLRARDGLERGRPGRARPAGRRRAVPGRGMRARDPARDARRRRRPPACARRAARALSRERWRGRRECRLARASHTDGGCGRLADAPAPAPSTGVRPVSYPAPAAPLGPPPYEPSRPTLLATAAFTLWPVLLSLPMFAGMWLASQWSDQYTAGLPFHAWSAEWVKRTGHLPLWNPEIFGG